MLRLMTLDLSRRRLRTAVAASGIAVGVAAVVALLALGTGIERGAAGLAKLGGAELGLFQAGRGDLTASRLPRSIADEARRRPGVSEATPVLVLTEALAGEDSVLVFGVEPGGFVHRRLVFSAGHALAGDDEIVIGDAAADDLGVDVGDQLSLGGAEVSVAGIYHSGVPFEDRGVAVTLALAQEISGAAEDATTIAVAVEPGASAGEIGAGLEDSFPGTFAVTEPGQAARVDTNALLVEKATVVLTALALFLGAIVVMNTTLMTVLERQGDFALLIAVGWPARMVVTLVVGQAALTCLIGAAIGIPLGILAGELAPGLVGASALVDPAVSIGSIALALGISLGMGIVGSAYPAWRVTRLRPAEALG